MSDQSVGYQFERHIPAEPALVYQALTNSTSLREWFCDYASTDPKPGGRIFLSWNSGFYATGEFTQIQKNKSIGYTWFGRDEPAPSEVCIELVPDGEHTLVRLVHQGIGSGTDWEPVIDEVQKGWEDSLDNLVSIFETGQDLRFVRRPMLGITVSDFNEEIAAQLGVPVSQGIRLDGVVEGMGAAAAGLKNNDVIISLAGNPVSDWPSLSNSLQHQHAGDVVEVVFYRNGERNSLEMKLSGRPLPDIPADPRDLAAAVQQRYSKGDQDLEAFLFGVTEEEASYRTASEEWSAREVLAHLIHGERGLQNWIAELISGQEGIYDDYPDNLTARVRSTAEAYGSVSALFAELKVAEREVVGLIAHIPEEFLARKASYWRVAYNTLEAPYHLYDHIEQMRAAVEAARQPA